MRDLENLLKTALEENCFLVNAAIQQKLIHYLELIQAWNRVFNLTAITDPREMVYLHIMDSLSVNKYLHGKEMLDVGTGAGLPGIPLAIINPDQNWKLLDKNSKKTRFLTQAIAELDLQNAQAIHARSEEFHPKQCFDSIISRAFASLHTFAETTGHLLCPNGKLIAMKGKYPQDEILDIPQGFHVEDILRLDIKGIEVERHIVRINKR